MGFDNEPLMPRYPEGVRGLVGSNHHPGRPPGRRASPVTFPSRPNHSRGTSTVIDENVTLDSGSLAVGFVLLQSTNLLESARKKIIQGVMSGETFGALECRMLENERALGEYPDWL